MKWSAIGSVVIGPHATLTNWVFEVVRLLATHHNERSIVRLDRDDVVGTLAAALPIYLTNYPSSSVVDAIRAGDLNVIFVVEDPRDVMSWQKRALALSALESVRAQTASAVANYAIARATNCLIIDRSISRSAMSVVRRIAEFLSLPLTTEACALAHNAADDRRPEELSLEQALALRGDSYAPQHSWLGASNAISPDDARIVSSVIDPLIAMARGDAIRPIVWPTAVFKFADKPDQPPPLEADISGPPRSIYYGPYLYLPPAPYRVEAILAFSEEIQDVPFVLEVHGQNWLATARIERRRAGGYRGLFQFHHVDPTPTLEIRLRNEVGIASGRLSLIELLFFPFEYETGNVSL